MLTANIYVVNILAVSHVSKFGVYNRFNLLFCLTNVFLVHSIFFGCEKYASV